jgi:hypothetical protein
MRRFCSYCVVEHECNYDYDLLKLVRYETCWVRELWVIKSGLHRPRMSLLYYSAVMLPPFEGTPQPNDAPRAILR